MIKNYTFQLLECFMDTVYIMCVKKIAIQHVCNEEYLCLIFWTRLQISEYSDTRYNHTNKHVETTTL